ncbi:MAG: Bug family tripartite tricarboxylate transporter substrate binding protein [Pseudomonadota bacterium]
MNRPICTALIAGALALTPLFATAQNTYPNRPIRMVVPFAPGGGSDISARVLADALGPALGTTIVVDNRPGAGSTLGTDIVSKASPDGYTTLLGNISMAFYPALYKNLPYNTLRDFTPVSLVVEQPNIMVAHPSLPAKTLKEFITLAQASPGKLTYGSAGLGSGTHLAMELLLISLKLKLIHVPYKGTGPALTALLGNETSVFMSTFASALPHVKSGRLRTFGVTTLKRASALPDTPTIAEAGVPGFDYGTWYGLLVPAGTPRAIVDKLNKATVEQLKTPALQQRYNAQGLDTIPSTSAEYMAKLKSETEKWAKVVREANIQQQ